MPDYNPSVALGVQPPQSNILPTLEGIAQLQIGQAHAGLYSLQQLQLQRRYNGLEAGAQAITNNQDPTPAMARAMGDPADIQTMQNVFAQRRAMMATPAGVAPDSQEKLNSIAASKYQAVVQSRGLDDDAYNNAVDAWGAANGKTALEIQHLKSIVNPQQRVQLARSQIMTGVPTGEAVKPQAISPESNVTTTMDYNAGNRASGPRGNVNTPSSVAEAAKSGAELGELPGKLATDASNAQNQQLILDQLKSEASNFPFQGEGTEAAARAAQILKPLANAMGSNAFDNFVGNYEAFQKNAGVLVRTATREVSSKAAFQEMQLIQKSLPTADMSAQGMNSIINQFSAVNDYKIAKQQAAQAWKDEKGTLAGFEADWTKNVSPSAFLVSRMSNDELHGMAAKLQQTDQGRAALKSMMKQIQYGKEHDLF